ncbi:hypothetical protein IFR04_015844 [Cadophora malorum]|uniref:NTF2-like protein n=1 Tax=Cadophora malorum TaxID=108018 RepID=A0A8H7VY41_9HELO|nr:hypothetical protein IFR04_015844 [Cadophora malorum]
MALQAAYQQFLAAPKESALASNASLHYITTLVTLNGSAAIIKHLGTQSHELKKKEEKLLDAVESANALAVEVHTTVEFVTGGGSYLPGLDDNFLADRVVTFPIIHIVSFNPDGKIQQIRQNWDQGSLLKLIDVIGKTGRNWPIRDGMDQIKLIASSVKLAGKVDSSDGQPTTRSRENSNNVTRDPHASLSLFQPRDKNYNDSLPAVVAPRSSAKPAPRNYHDLFVGQDGSPELQTKPELTREASDSSSIAPKGGAGKNYHPSRLFDLPDEDVPSPDKKGNPAKYQHFNLGEVSEDRAEKRPPLKEVKSSKHSSQWNFDDFNTPQRVVPSKVLRTNDVRHWGTSDDEVTDSPVKIKKVDKPRKDAETHFEFQDDGTPDGPRLIGRPRGAGANNGMGIYKNNMFDEEDAAAAGPEPVKPTLANVKERSKDFNPQFAMTDDSPAGKPGPQRIPEDRAKVLKNMDANWAAYDQSPNQKENGIKSPTGMRPNSSKGPLAENTNSSSNRVEQHKGITIAGDGMGGRKGAGRLDSSSKGITVGGDGMGGKKGAGRQWGFGDESDGEEVGGANTQTKYRTGKTQGKAQATGGDFWDF